MYEPTSNFLVRLTKSNTEIVWNDLTNNLLELIETAGIIPQSSCRMGVCGTCESKLISGTYEYDPEPFVETAINHLLICCARPTSDIEIEL